jgi:hypothetical protein
MDSVRDDVRDDEEAEEDCFPRDWWDVCDSRTFFRSNEVDKVKANTLPGPSCEIRNGNRRAVSARTFMVTMM